MKRLEKIIRLTTNIYKLYQDLLNMELQGLNGNSDYLEKLEILGMYKELEDKYYRELERKYEFNEIKKMKQILNVDNLLGTEKNDLDFVLQDVRDNIDETLIIKRRIINKLTQLILKNIDESQLLPYARQELYGFCFERESLSLSLQEVINFIGILNVLNIAESATEIVFTRYIFFIEDYIKNQVFSELFITQKYTLSFINYHVEEKMFKVNFNVDEKFIRSTKDKEENPVEQEIYDFCLDKNAIKSLKILIQEALIMSNEKFTKKEQKIFMHELQALVRANLIEIGESIKKMICMMLYSSNKDDNEKEKIMRKELSNIIRKSKKDKEYL